jgi:hypothetical protein
MHSNPFAKGLRAFSNVDGHIKYRTHWARHELSLRIGTLKMKPPQDSSARHTEIILDENTRDSSLLISFMAVRLEEISSVITKNFWLYDEKIVYFRFDYVHGR